MNTFSFYLKFPFTIILLEKSAYKILLQKHLKAIYLSNSWGGIAQRESKRLKLATPQVRVLLPPFTQFLIYKSYNKKFI